MLKFVGYVWSCLFAGTLTLASSTSARAHYEGSQIELSGTFAGSFSASGSGQLGSMRLPARYFLLQDVSLGLEARYWPSGSYPLSDGTGSVVAPGVNGQFYFVNRSRFGAYVGGTALWIPSHGQVVLAPEVGCRVFIVKHFALGMTYDIVTDLGSFLLSLSPGSSRGSIQSLGLSAIFEL